MYDSNQGGITTLVPLHIDAQSAQAKITALPQPVSLPGLHFISIALVSLSIDNELPTHILIEANYDGTLAEFANAWSAAQPDTIQTLYSMGPAQWHNGGENQLQPFLHEYDWGTGAYYNALVGVSVSDIWKNEALTQKVGASVRSLKTPVEDAPSSIFASLKKQHGTRDYPRKFRVRFGPFATTVVRKAILAFLILCTWVLTRLWQNSDIGLSVHYLDAVLLLAFVAIVVTLMLYVDHRRSGRRSAVFARDGGDQLKTLALTCLTLAVVGLVVWLTGSLTFSGLFALLLYLVFTVLIWPGPALAPFVFRHPLSPLEELTRQSTLLSLLGLVAVLGLHWLLPDGHPAERATTLVVTTVAIMITAGSALFEARLQGGMTKPDFIWIAAPVLIAPVIDIDPASTVTAVLMLFAVIPIVALHGFAFEFAKVRSLEREQLARRPPSAAKLEKIAQFEDRPDKYQNHLLSVTRVHPQRVIALRLVLMATRLALYMSSHKGTLMGIPSIHFARWVLVKHAGHHFLIFLSNYDGPFDSYLDEFIDQASTELNLIWGPTVGFPRTEWMITGGASRNEEFKRYARSSQSPTLFHYCAYPELSLDQIEEQMRLRQALAGTVNEGEESDLLTLFHTGKELSKS